MNRLSRQLCAAVTASLSGQKARPPEAGRMLWNAFQRLSAARTYHAAGPNPLQLSEVQAFCQLMRLPLEPRHVAVLLDMDRAWLAQVAIQMRAKAQPESKVLAARSSRPLTADLLDTVLG